MTASTVFWVLAAVAAIAGVVLLLVLGRRRHTRIGGIIGGVSAILGAALFAWGAVSFAELEAAALRTFTPQERAVAVPCKASVLGADVTSSKINGKRIWWVRLRVTPQNGGPYEIKRSARLSSAMGNRLERGDVELPCLVAPGDGTRIEISALT
jgi:hypothetical protein